MLTVIVYLNSRNKIVRVEKEKEIMQLQVEKEKQLVAFSAAVEAEENQKETLAVNLHDNILPRLTAIGQMVEQHKKDLKRKILSEADFDTEISLINGTIEDIRLIAIDLIPVVFMKFGLVKALEQYIRQRNSKAFILDFENKLQDKSRLPFSKSQQITLYRICTEIVNNLNKHTGHTYLRVTFSDTKNNFSVLFTHDGKGITNQEIEDIFGTSLGLGLNLLKSRLLVLNATINYYIEPNAACVELNIPLSA